MNIRKNRVDFIFYFLVIIALFIGVFVNIANLKEQIWVLQTQLTELQKHLLSFTQQHYLSNKANVEEESYIDQTSTEPIVNNNPDTENKNNQTKSVGHLFNHRIDNKTNIKRFIINYRNKIAIYQSSHLA